MKAVITKYDSNGDVEFELEYISSTPLTYWQCSGHGNDEIFTRLGIDAEDYCSRRYRIAGGVWPEIDMQDEPRRTERGLLLYHTMMGFQEHGCSVEIYRNDEDDPPLPGAVDKLAKFFSL